MGHADILAAGLGKLIGQKDRQPPVGAHEQDLLHRPHGVGKALCRHLGDVSVEKIIDECISRTEVLADIRDVRIEKTVKNDFNLNCDFRWICEAVSNIVKNCIEHTDGGYVRISAEKNSMYSEITISDNGCGISPKDLPHIFERFYKAQNSSPSSVGIGLSLAKSIVEKTGGYITADSKLGVGSTFKLRFLNVRLR